MRFAAPEHTTGITLSIGPVSVIDGFVEVPDDIGPGDLGGLVMNGFVLLPADTPAAAPAAAPAPARALKADPVPASDNPTP